MFDEKNLFEWHYKFYLSCLRKYLIKIIFAKRKSAKRTCCKILKRGI